MSALTPFILAEEKNLPFNAPPTSRVPWPFAIACCLYYFFAYRGLVRGTSIFAKLFDGLGVAIPFPTRLLIATYWWVYPLIFLGAVILTIFKQFVSLGELRLRIANLFLIFAGVVFPVLVVLIVYLPLFVLIWKLKHAS
ncbi:MAG TPA: hypothetical protein VF748_06085 [Candidatus Acidoferrum sp.]